MISDKQLQANRNNALKSTGPKTAEGKAISSQNATRHGLLAKHVVIRDENGAEFETFMDNMTEYFQPVGILEQLLVNRIAASFWRLNRAGRIEVEMLNIMFTPGSEQKSGNTLPFVVHITKTYQGSPEKYEDPIEDENKFIRQKIRSEREEKGIEDLTLGQAVKADFTSDNLLEKLHRYKGHIDRTLYKALHELQRLQSMRQGQQVTPPQAVDIDINPMSNIDPI